MESIGARVLERISQICPESLHREIADDIGMTPDAFSRALSGKRQFSSLELARTADRLQADLHWLITGVPDSNRLLVAARHNFDASTGQRDVPDRNSDEAILNNIALAYRQAYRDEGLRTSIPEDPAKTRHELGDGFVRPLAERIEEHLGVDIVRLADLSTAYSFTLGGRRVIALRATGNWFWENWSMAHELGHLALGHADLGLDARTTEAHERAANSYAAELLMPEFLLEEVDWDQVDDVALAKIVWTWGVSTAALATRLNVVLGHVPSTVLKWSASPTQRLLRYHLEVESEIDEITQRMDDASQRRFPLGLQEAHLESIASGSIGKGTLAWMLGIDADALEVDSPDVEEVTIDDLAGALGL